MAWFHESQDHLPVTWWKGHPIYLAAFLALVGAASMVVTAILGPAVGFFVFSYENLFQRYFVWTPLTYALVNGPSLWTLVGCVLLWRFGEQLERHFGRRAFVRLVICQLAVLPLLICMLGLAGFRNLNVAGIWQLEFGIFVAFATLYPRAQISLIIVNIDAWILAAAIIGISALSCVANRDWLALLMLAAEVGTAYGFVRYEQGLLKMPALKDMIPSRPRKAAAPMMRPARPAKQARPVTRSQLEVDEILDKISRDGMHSLTPEERVILERASDDLQKRKR